MAGPQKLFVTQFRQAFGLRFGNVAHWIEGQGKVNAGQLTPDPELRRCGEVRANEHFELGDLRADLGGYTVIVEFESDWVAVHNLVKYWPYLRGEMMPKPTLPVVLCHFSNWGSYGSYRDLWKWMEARMAADPQRLVDFCGCQFDHGGKDQRLRDRSVELAMSWLGQFVGISSPQLDA